MEKPKIIVVVGQTASGKTSLSITLAQKYSGEVISADSRQVYTGLDIGSGKVTKNEMDGIAHHLLDVADPMDTYTAADFTRDATAAVSDITGRGKLPIVAGGTFFYVDALLGKISYPEVPPNMAFRATLKDFSTPELFAQLETLDARRAATIDPHNRRRLERALEIVDALGTVPEQTTDEPYDALVIGIEIDTETLHHNIHTRLLERLDAGMVDEVKGLLAKGVTHERLERFGLEYRYISRYLREECTYDEMVSELETKIKQFAKRQKTWLQRDSDIKWFDKNDTETIFSTVDTFLKN